jgi:hypothetical protein
VLVSAITCQQVEAQTRLSVATGAAIPIGLDADKTKIGYQTALAISMGQSRSPTRLRFEGAVAELMDRAPALTTRRVSSLSGNVVLTPVSASSTAPSGYVTAGIGAYSQRVAGVGTNHGGLNIGAGIMFNFGRYGSFVESRLHYIFSDPKTKLFPITFGLVF